MLEEILKKAKEKMVKALEHFEAEIAGIRSGRASTGLVDDIKVDVYGAAMSIKSIASSTVMDAASIKITPWDKSNIGHIEKAISNSGIGVTVSNMGEYLRVALPPLTDERRKEYQKLVDQKGEEDKVGLRNIRRDAMDEIKDLEKKGQLTEDDRYTGQKQLDELISDFEKKIDEMAEKKNKELQG